MMRTNKILSIILCSILLSNNIAIKNAHSKDNSITEKKEESKESKNFTKWLLDFKEKVLNHKDYNISDKTLQIAFENIKFNEKILKSDAKQAEFAETFWEYIEKRINEYRINKGKELYKKHKSLLRDIHKKYGVPPEYILSFWGLETGYGNYFGSTNIFEALALLTFEGRRAQMFETELLTALEILEQNKLEASQMKGSWAGAMGNFQFMPTTFKAYKIDGDGNGKIDVWNSIPDAMHSAANYLHKIGWKDGKRWGREVFLPKNFNWMQVDDYDIKRTTTEWKKQGVMKTNGKPLDESDVKGYIIAPQGKDGPTFLVYNNFDKILNWNYSYNYAIAVGLLADAISRNTNNTIITKEKINNKIPIKNIIEIQKELNRLGYYKSDDLRGVLNIKTKFAIKRYQRDNKMLPDGYPSKELYLKIFNKSISN